MSSRKPAPRSTIVIYGVHPVLETLRAHRRPVDEVFWTGGSTLHSELDALLESGGYSVTSATGEQIRTMSRSPHHQGIAARVGPFPYVDLEDLLAEQTAEQGPLVILDEIQDTGNLGSILRSTECLGGTAVVMSTDRSVAVTPAVEKAAAGASAHLPVARVGNLVRALHRIKESRYWVYGADARARDHCYALDLKERIAFVLGAEGKGIRRLVRETCDGLVSIPMRGEVGSLNVSQSAAILLSEALRQRIGQSGHPTPRKKKSTGP